jgi:glycogen debranching enzyme
MSQENGTPVTQIDLLPGETVTSIRPIASTRRPHHPDATRALASLARVDSREQIGRRGPVLAAIAHPGVADPAFHSFEAVFGRDSLVSALSVASQFPTLLLETVRYLAIHQGQKVDKSKAEEPGKIPHEIRSPDDPVAAQLTTEHGWGWPYYGSIDATPLFLLACARCAATSEACLDITLRRDDGSTTSLRQSVRKAAEWLAAKLESSTAGFLETSAVHARGGLANQTWKDSWDAYSTADGTIVMPPVASVEVQALAFDAAQAASRLLRDMAPELAARLQVSASRVQGAVLNILWLDDSGHFALGARNAGPGVGYQPIAVAASNMGHLLDSGLLTGPECAEMRQRTVEKLFTPELLCAGGIRTLGTNEVRYRAGSYHNGSCWPWDTAKIVRGLRRFGFHRLANALGRRVADVCFQFGGFPEFCRGDANAILFNDRVVDVRDRDGRPNRIEQPPQQVQAWTVAAIIELKSESTISPQSESFTVSAAQRSLEERILDGILRV